MSMRRISSLPMTRLAVVGVALGVLACAQHCLSAEPGSDREDNSRQADRSGGAPTSRPHPRIGGPLFPRLRPPANSPGSRENPGNGSEPLGMGDGELREFAQFVAQHMPNTVGALRDKPVEAGESQQDIVRSLFASRATIEKRKWLATAAVFQFRRYNRGKRDFPDLANQYLQDVKDTDDMVALLIQYRQADEGGREKLKTELRTKLQSVARSMLDERKRRIERLRESLEKEEAQLSRDESRMDEALEHRLDEMIGRALSAPAASPAGSGSNGNTVSTPATQPAQ